MAVMKQWQHWWCQDDHRSLPFQCPNRPLLPVSWIPSNLSSEIEELRAHKCAGCLNWVTKGTKRMKKNSSVSKRGGKNLKQENRRQEEEGRGGQWKTEFFFFLDLYIRSIKVIHEKRRRGGGKRKYSHMEARIWEEIVTSFNLCLERQFSSVSNFIRCCSSISSESLRDFKGFSVARTRRSPASGLLLSSINLHTEQVGRFFWRAKKKEQKTR